MSDKTAIQTFQQQALGHPGRIKVLGTMPEILDGLAQQFPGRAEDGLDKANRLLRQAYIHIANSQAMDKLCRCSGESFLQSLLDCASLDLSLNKAQGEAYLVPYGPVCTMMVGYKGFLTLIYRTGAVHSVQVDAVYQGDEFAIRSGTNPGVTHVLAPDVPRDDVHLRGVYCIVNHLDGPPSIEWMNREQIAQVQRSSKAAHGPWQYWYVEMAKKSVVRRMQKMLPKRADDLWGRKLLEAEEIDNRDFGLMRAEARATLSEHSREVRELAEKTAEEYAREAAEEVAKADDD